MGKVTYYCEKCGEMVPEQDIEKARAIILDSKAYCVKCKASVAPAAPPQPAATPTKTPAKPGSATSSSAVLKREAFGTGVTRVPAAAAKSATDSAILRAMKRPAPPGAQGKAGTGSSHYRTVEKTTSTPARGTRKIPRIEDDEEPAGRRLKYQKPKSNAWLYLAIIAGVIVVILIAKFLLGGGSSETTGVPTRPPDECRRDIERSFAEVTDILKVAARNTVGAEQKLRELKAAIDAARPVLSIQEISLYEKRREDMRKEFDRIVATGAKKQELENRRNALVTQLSGAVERADLESLAEQADTLFEDAKTVLGPEELSNVELVQKNAWKRVMKAYRSEADQLVNASGAETKVKLEAYRKGHKLLEEVMGKLAKKLGEGSDDMIVWLADFQRNIDFLEAKQACEELEAKVQGLVNEKKFIEALDACDAFPNKYNNTEFWKQVGDLAAMVRQQKRDYEAAQQKPPDTQPKDMQGFESIVENGVARLGQLTPGGTVTINWRTEGAELIGKHPGTRLNPPTPQAHEFDAFLTVGEDSWKNYEVFLEFNVVDVGVLLGARANLSQRKAGRPVWLVPPTVTVNTWNTIGVLVQDDNITVTMNGKQFPAQSGLNAISARGRIILALYPGAEVRIKNLKLKRLPE